MITRSGKRVEDPGTGSFARGALRLFSCARVCVLPIVSHAVACPLSDRGAALLLSPHCVTFGQGYGLLV